MLKNINGNIILHVRILFDLKNEIESEKMNFKNKIKKHARNNKTANDVVLITIYLVSQVRKYG